MQPTPRSLVLDLLSTLRRGAFPVGALVAAGEVFGLEAGTVRVALTRLLEAELVERAARGWYRLGPSASAVHGRVVAWAGLEAQTRPWSGAWVAVHGAESSPADRTARHRDERALRLLGFRELARGLAIRPDNLTGGVAGVREALLALGLRPAAIVATLDGLEAGTDARGRALWDVVALRRATREAIHALARSERRLARLGAREALRESFLVGGRALRELTLDPLLPEPFVPATERQALVSAMRRYDRLGKAQWKPFLEAYGVRSPRTPADTRGAAHGAAIAAAGGMGA